MSAFPPRSGSPVAIPGSAPDPVLITGGAGFIGCNLADHLLSRGQRVRIFDNVSRPGVERNLAWLRSRHGDLVQLRLCDVRDPHAMDNAVRGVDPVFHFAAQVAVTTSLSDPSLDFDINARGTLNLLEALRRSSRRHPLVFTSTNKVYGHLDDIALTATFSRYDPLDPALRLGFDESRPVCFQSPFGCSKGAADQYVLDCARTFGLPALVLRLGCVYGQHQCGDEEQGWITHFLVHALAGRPITLFGDGKQVQDALHIDDLVDALLIAQERIDVLSGRAFNLGGGPAHTTSPLELLALIREIRGQLPAIKFADWRAADPRYFVSDVRRFCAATGWSPRISLPAGVARLHRWLAENEVALAAELAA